MSKVTLSIHTFDMGMFVYWGGSYFHERICSPGGTPTLTLLVPIAGLSVGVGCWWLVGGGWCGGVVAECSRYVVCSV